MSTSRLVAVEGIMGSGKSTLVRFLARQIRLSGTPVRSYVETRRGRSNPTDVLRSLREDLRDPAAVWDRITPDALELRSLEKWEAFVERARTGREAGVFDGQVFGGDLTGLFLMDVGPDAVERYFRRLMEVARPLDPVLVHLRHSRPDQVLRRIAERRGPRWTAHQTGWKLASPYARGRRLEGLEGWIEAYRDLQALADRLHDRFEGRKIRLDDPHADWPRTQAAVLRGIGLRRRADPAYRLWWWSKRGRLHLARALRHVG